MYTASITRQNKAHADIVEKHTNKNIMFHIKMLQMYLKTAYLLSVSLIYMQLKTLLCNIKKHFLHRKNLNSYFKKKKSLK